MEKWTWKCHYTLCAFMRRRCSLALMAHYEGFCRCAFFFCALCTQSHRAFISLLCLTIPSFDRFFAFLRLLLLFLRRGRRGPVLVFRSARAVTPTFLALTSSLLPGRSRVAAFDLVRKNHALSFCGFVKFCVLRAFWELIFLPSETFSV